jgi:carbamoyltransferase
MGPITEFLAEQLAAGKIAGLFQGRLEAGPRALGNRSILASPLIPDVAGRLNAAVKFREPFRPFAPVILAEHAPTYFRLGQPSPFMAIAAPATSLAREKVPVIVHANGTARVQIGQDTTIASPSFFRHGVQELLAVPCGQVAWRASKSMEKAALS